MSEKSLQAKSSSSDSLKDYFSEVVSASIEANHPSLLGLKLSLLTAEEGTHDIPIGLLRFLSIKDIKALQRAKQEEKNNFSNLLLQLSVDRALERIDHLISFYQEQLEFLLDQIHIDQEKLEILQKQNEGLKNVIDQYRESGYVDWKSPGQLQIQSADSALQAYLQNQPTDTETADVYLLLLNVQADIQKQTEDIENKIEDNTHKYELYQFNWEKAQSIKDDLQSNDPKLQTVALKALSELEKDMEFAVEMNAKGDLQDDYEVIESKGINSNSGENKDIIPINILSDLEPLEEPNKVKGSTVPKL
ncbi:MAG: hypothetical protein AAFO07_09510 [Bacteroidota bacterium]